MDLVSAPVHLENTIPEAPVRIVMEDALCVMEARQLVAALRQSHNCVLLAKTMEQTITSRLLMLMLVLKRVLMDNILA